VTVEYAAATSYTALVGLFIGSFINLAADRIPRHESVVAPRSHCTACGRVLNVIDLLPVAGYLIRGGRCASCGAGIGGRQPIIELIAGLSMLLPSLIFGLWPGALYGALLTAALGITVVTVAVQRAKT